MLKYLQNMTLESHSLWIISWTILACILLVTRLSTALAKWRNDTFSTAALKPISILPYWVPYIGHAVDFAWSFDDVMARGSTESKDGVFGLRVFGRNHHVVLMPSLVKQYFAQRSSALSNDDFIYRIWDKCFGDGGASRKLHPDELHAMEKTLNTLLREPFVSVATSRSQQLIENRMSRLVTLNPEKAPPQPWERFASVSHVDPTTVEADLYPLCMDFVGDIAGRALMGDAFIDNNPDIVRDLWLFDDGLKALLTGVPGITARGRKAKSARSRLHCALKERNDAVIRSTSGQDVDPKWKNLDDVSEIMLLRIKTAIEIGSEEAFLTASSLLLFWGSMVNTGKVVFWMLLHILADTKLHGDVLKEMGTCIDLQSASGKARAKIDSAHFSKFYPLLKACFYETMRKYIGAVSYKLAVDNIMLSESKEDASILGKDSPQTYHISKDDFLVIPHAVMQMDPRLWETPDRFDPTRFIDYEENSGQMTAKSLHLNAFGGGQTMCKGRLFAEREVLLFIVAFINQWNFASVKKELNMIPKREFVGGGGASPKGKVRVLIKSRA